MEWFNTVQRPCCALMSNVQVGKDRPDQHQAFTFLVISASVSFLFLLPNLGEPQGHYSLYELTSLCRVGSSLSIGLPFSSSGHGLPSGSTGTSSLTSCGLDHG